MTFRMHAALIVAAICCGGIVNRAEAITYTTSGVYDENVNGANTVDTDAFNTAGNAALVSAGQVISQATLTADVATAFASNSGGVIDFDSLASNPGGTDFDATYGISQANNLHVAMTSFTGGAAPAGGLSLVVNLTTAAVAISGNGTNLNHMGTGSGVIDFGLAFDKPLSEIGVTVLQRTAARTINVRVVLDDASLMDFATETQAAWSGSGTPDDDTFFGARAPAGRTIAAIRFDFNAAHRIDDLAFVVVPEPSSLALMIFVLGGIVLALRRPAWQRAVVRC